MQLISYMSPGFPRSLFTTFARAIGAEVAFDETQSGPDLNSDPFRSGAADLGWVCSTSFVDLACAHPDPSATLVGVGWVPTDPGSLGKPVYFGDLVTLPDSGIRSFEELAGRTVGCNDEISLSGNYSLRFALAERGLQPDFVDRVYTGGHHCSLDKLLSGELDAAVIDSVVRTTRAHNDPTVAGLHIIERLGPWPVQPLVARAGLASTVVDRIRDSLLEATERPEVQAELRNAGLAGLAEVDAAHYAPVRKALDQLRSM